MKTATGKGKRPVVRLTPVFEEEWLPLKNKPGEVRALQA